MTAVLISSRPMPARARADAATFRRRRATVSAVAVAMFTLVGVVVVGPSGGPGGVPASATGAQPAVVRESVVARPGDTLWSLAHQHRGNVSHEAFVDALVRLNGGASIEVGQRIVLP